MPISNSYKPEPAVEKELTPPSAEGFADVVEPARFPALRLRFRNQQWAERIGLGELTDEEWKKHFALFEALPGNQKKPLALRYHGHQFRSYNPNLGDGRGFLFAQLRDGDRLLDLGTKGSGQTPYSRAGDGRLTLKGAVREILATEMLESYGVNTSKTFSVFETGEELERHDEPSPTRAGVLVRLNHSHVRFGTFQRFAFHREPEQIAKLVEYCCRHFYPEAKNAADLLREVALRSADLCAQWMTAGFVHGVLNTDNMNITGESFDYGPYRFMPNYDPEFTAAYFDESGLYSYGRQPETVLWNLEQLASALSPVSERDDLAKALSVYALRFNERVSAHFVKRMGVESQGEEADGELFMASFNLLAMAQPGFAQFFHDWYGGIDSRDRALGNSPHREVYVGEHFDVFIERLSAYKSSADAKARLADPYFKRAEPCSLLIDEIEAIWEPIASRDDWSKFEAKITEIRAMGKTYGNR